MTKHDLTNDAHRATCAECTATWAELEAISAEARALPTLTPSRDLWSGIEARIGGAPAAASAATMKARARWTARPALRYAAAAALLIMVTATVTWRIATDRPADVTELASAPSDSEAAVNAALRGNDALLTVSYDADFTAMDGEIRALQELLATRRDQLDSSTVAVLEKSITLIDQAIAESRAALAKDPASQFLAAQLARSYSTKLTLLRSTATLPVGI